MAHYDFTDQAENDLVSIIDFTIEQWGNTQAEKYLNGFEELAQNIANSPDIGVNKNQLFEGLISFPYGSHIIYYVKQPHGITIIRILHKHMEPDHHIRPSQEK